MTRRMNYTPGDGGVTVRSGPKLLDQVRNRLRVLHYSLCTEQAYLSWIRRFILASGKHYLVQLGQMEVEAFFTRLAIQAKASAGTQNQALAALLFLSSDVLRLDRHHVSDEISRVQDLESWRHSA
ncbi:recombinase [Xanthomonas oryzae pv. oryzae PXO86]|uniref:Site-specific recombinase n=3 Tax=Xanthomonas oryzae pv. oryzae TaxID=64187 RepID=Q5GZY8_XANOR|nr:site-specific recombinase [Xanthomonas oryzae pv. oryzae KACC 10331]AJQ83505.1 recombinase [Xanthomonas oryzae pv. oryzae PXO86]